MEGAWEAARPVVRVPVPAPEPSAQRKLWAEPRLTQSEAGSRGCWALGSRLGGSKGGDVDCATASPSPLCRSAGSVDAGAARSRAPAPPAPEAAGPGGEHRLPSSLRPALPGRVGWGARSHSAHSAEPGSLVPAVSAGVSTVEKSEAWRGDGPGHTAGPPGHRCPDSPRLLSPLQPGLPDPGDSPGGRGALHVCQHGPALPSESSSSLADLGQFPQLLEPPRAGGSIQGGEVCRTPAERVPLDGQRVQSEEKSWDSRPAREVRALRPPRPAQARLAVAPQ